MNSAHVFDANLSDCLALAFKWISLNLKLKQLTALCLFQMQLQEIFLFQICAHIAEHFDIW